jgi:hypothetical protein
MIGDHTPEKWCDIVFGYHKNAGDLTNYRFLGENGIDVVFTIDMTIDQLGLTPDHSIADSSNSMYNLLGGWINDSDHEIISAGVGVVINA